MDAGVTRAWLLGRVDDACVDAAAGLLDDIAETLAVATGDAVSIRMCSADGTRMTPVASHDADPERALEIAEVTKRTTQPADVGLWRDVVANRRPRRWQVSEQTPPVEASATQVDFLARLRIRAVLGVPVVHGDAVVGGMALIRFVPERPFTDDDEALLVSCGERVLPALLLLRAAGAL
ncbi:GAF domain-containing protein [Jatrophihabitans fulvus]